MSRNTEPAKLPHMPFRHRAVSQIDRKSTRLNSSHSQISYAVFCLKKKKNESRHERKNKCMNNTTCRQYSATSHLKKKEQVSDDSSDRRTQRTHRYNRAISARAATL